MFHKMRMAKRVMQTLMTADDTLRVQRFYQIIPPKEEFAGRSTTYMNLGYWDDGVNTLDEAADRLAMVLAEAATFEPANTVLDVGFGHGDQDFHWLRDNLVQSVTGLNITPHHVESAQKRARKEGLTGRATFQVSSAVEMPFEDGTFDRVVALESAFHFYPRQKFFEEAFRVLKPGGILATADIIPFSADTDRMALQAGPLGFLKFSVDQANWHDAAVYQDNLAAAGFAGVSVKSIADRVWEPWRAFMANRLQDPVFEKQIGRESHKAMAGHWDCQEAMRQEVQLLDYIIASARKPA